MKLKDLIDRQTAIDALDRFSLGETDAVKLAFRMGDYLKRLPSVQPERKTGHWVDMGDFEQCSICTGTRLKEFQSYYGKATWIRTPYCPNCGAKMKIGDET